MQQEVLIITVVSSLSHVQLFETPSTVALQAPVSVRFPRQEYFSGLPFPSPRDLSDSGIKLTSLVSPALAGQFFIAEPPGKPGNATVRLLKSGSEMSSLYPCTSVSSSLGVPWLGMVIAWALREHPANTTLLLCAFLAARLEPWAN